VRLELVGLAVIVLVTVAGNRVTVLAGLVMVLAMVRVTVAAKADRLIVLILVRTDTRVRVNILVVVVGVASSRVTAGVPKCVTVETTVAVTVLV
jgi:hypothetical protein